MESILNSHQQDVIFSEILETERLKQSHLILEIMQAKLTKAMKGSWIIICPNEIGTPSPLIEVEGSTPEKAIENFVLAYKGLPQKK